MAAPSLVLFILYTRPLNLEKSHPQQKRKALIHTIQVPTLNDFRPDTFDPGHKIFSLRTCPDTECFTQTQHFTYPQAERETNCKGN